MLWTLRLLSPSGRHVRVVKREIPDTPPFQFKIPYHHGGEWQGDILFQRQDIIKLNAAVYIKIAGPNPPKDWWNEP